MYVLDCSCIWSGISTNCFCSCELRCSRAECNSLPCCFDLATLGLRYLWCTPSGIDCLYSKRHLFRLFFQL